MEFSVKDILVSVIPLFVAIDALGVVPLYVSLTEQMEEGERRRLTRYATLTAVAVSVAFLLGGRFVFEFMGVTEADFRVAGGVLLLVLAVNDLLFSQDKQRSVPEATVGVVPIGVPLIVGPAALTTLLILVDTHGFALAFLSLLVNLLWVWIVFLNADRVIRLMGHAGSRAFSKVMSLILAALGVMMVRVGFAAMLKASAG